MPGYDELTRVMRDLERLTPTILDAAVNRAANRELPRIKAATPKKTGSLAAANKVTSGASGKTVFANSQPYGNTIHWGRKRLRGVPNVVQGRPYVVDTLRRDLDQIGRDLSDELVTELNKASS